MTTRLVAGALCLAATLPLAARQRALVDTFDAAWTIVRDTHFDPQMNGVDWDAVRAELRPRALAASTQGELRAVIREMLDRLGQSHFALIPFSADSPRQAQADTSGDPGFDVRIAGHDVLVTSVTPKGPAATAGVRTGWRVVSIGGVAVPDVLSSLDSSVSARVFDVEAWRIVENRLRGPEGTSVAVEFEDGSGSGVGKSIERRPEEGEPVTVGHLPTMRVRLDAEKRRTPGGGTVGVIRFNVWMPAVDALFAQAVDDFRAADGIVIDLRGNPGGLAAMIMGVSGHFLSVRKPLGLMKTRDSELAFVSNPRLVSATGARVVPFAGPVAILIDSLTGSASECFTGGMQSMGRARVFGQQSMGQALPALFDVLPNGDLLIHAYGDFVTSNGTRLEGRGVIPDQEVPLRREDLLAGRDATLGAALAWIDTRREAAGTERR